MPPRPEVVGRRCNCGADGVHEHLLARDADGNPNSGGNVTLQGFSSIALNGYIRKDFVKGWNYETRPKNLSIANVFGTKKQPQHSSNDSEGSNTDAAAAPSAASSSSPSTSINTNTNTNTNTTGGGAATDDEYVTVRSDADDELLIYCPFTEFLTIRAMMVSCDPNCPPPEEPSSLSLFVNRQDAHLGFSDVRRAQAAQNLRLGAANAPGDAVIYMLDGSKFRSVSALTLFFKTSYGGDNTQVQRIVFFGESTREPVHRGIATNVVTETMADPAEHVRRLNAEANTRVAY